MGMPLDDQFEMPVSLRACFADNALRASVEQILAGSGFPAGIEWDEVEAFLKARAAAENIRWEYGLGLVRLHQAIWGDPQDWTRCSVDDAASETSFKAAKLWDDEDMAVKYTSGDKTLYLLAGFDAGKVWIGFSLFDGDHEQDVAIEGFERDDGDEYAFWETRGNLAINPSILGTVRAKADEAMQHIKALA